MRERLPDVLENCLPDRILMQLRLMQTSGKLPLDALSEIRLRVERPASFTVSGQNILLPDALTQKEMADCVSALCGGSVYAHDDTICEGYIAVYGGIRVGVCGTRAGNGVREITSLCIRIPHAISHICQPILDYMEKKIDSLLLYAPPGVGKTTLLRDLAAQLAKQRRVVLLDTRGELYIEEMFRDTLCDVLIGYERAEGIELATRTMSPEVIICDELGDADEAKQILGVQNTGVPLIASAHAASLDELLARPNIRLLHDHRVFDVYGKLSREKAGGRFSRACSFVFTKAEDAVSCSV